MSGALQLRLVRSHGDAMAVVWPLVPGQALTMDVAYAESPVAASAEQAAAARMCRVHGEGAMPGGAVIWWLSNGSAELACAVNQRHLAQGERLRLTEGDAIELGLLQFVVESRAAGAASAETASSPAPDARPAVYDDFELTDLLRPDPASRRTDATTQQMLQAKASRQLIDAHADPFNDITDVSYRIDVVQPGTSPTPASIPAEEARSPSEPEQPQQPTDTSPLQETADPAAEVMRQLHAEYLRLMHNPAEPVAAMNWSLRDNPPDRADQTLHDLTKDAERFDSVYDILGHGSGIQAILDSLDTLSDTNLLAEDPKVNVLRLFAPEDLLMQETRLPGLTLREHHALSADSAAALDRPRPDHRENT